MSNSTEESSFMSPVIRAMLKYFVSYVSIVFICAGMVGNSCSLVIFYRNRRKDRVSSQYLSVLALSDLISLTAVATVSWTFSNLHQVSHGRLVMRYQMPTQFACQLWAFLWNTLAFTSAWIVVIFSIERCLVIWQPLKMAPLVSSSKPRKIAMLAVFIFGLTISAPHFHWNVLIQMGDRYGCGLRTDLSLNFIIVANFCIFGPAFGIPLVIICVVNIMILLGIHANKLSNDVKSKTNDKTEVRCLMNLMGVSLLYMVTISPLVVICALYPYYQFTGFRGFTPTGVQDLLILMLSAHAFSHMNFACNPLIYCFSLDFYREELIRLLCPCFQKKSNRPKNESLTMSTNMD